MKILHCLAQLPTRTGSGVYYRNLISEMKKQKAWEQAGIFGLNSNHTASWLVLDQVYPVHFETEDLPFPIAGMSDEMPYNSTVYHQMSDEMIQKWKAAFREQLKKAKEEFNPDLIICHHLWMLCALVLESFPDVPVIGISHGTDLRQAKQNPSMAKEHVGSLAGLKKVLSLSESDVNDLQSLFDLQEDQVVVTGGAYDPSVFYPCQSRSIMGSKLPIRIIYAGKITDSKGVFELVEAYSRVRKVYPELTLDLVGRESQETIDRINQLSGHDPSIHLFDVESQDVLASHMRRSDLFAFASYYEGLGLIALEALASGLHLVSNRLPGLCEQLGEELGSDPVITWVDLPELKNLDEITEEARPDYVERLTEALLQQVEYIYMKGKDVQFPYEKIEEHSWRGLAGKITELIEKIS